MKGFPHKNFFGFPKGWEDRGKVGSTYDPERETYLSFSHEYCSTVLYIGIEADELFRFCPLCLVKVK